MWSFDKNLMVLKEFDAEFMELEEVDFGKEEIWLHVTRLPLRFMDKEMATTIGL